jgi:hypothetical protein
LGSFERDGYRDRREEEKRGMEGGKYGARVAIDRLKGGAIEMVFTDQVVDT